MIFISELLSHQKNYIRVNLNCTIWQPGVIENIATGIKEEIMQFEEIK
jgi:hypothetical protein